MQQQEIDFTGTRFYGAGFDPEQDKKRLTGQLRCIFSFMASRCNKWVTLRELSAGTGAPEASASAALRSLRNEHGFIIEKMREEHGRGTWLYKLVGRGEPPKRKRNALKEENERLLGVLEFAWNKLYILHKTSWAVDHQCKKDCEKAYLAVCEALGKEP